MRQNCFNLTVPLTEIKKTAREGVVQIPLLLAMEGIPWELIEHSTANQQAVMLEIVKDRRKDLSDIMTNAVWGIFAKN